MSAARRAKPSTDAAFAAGARRLKASLRMLENSRRDYLASFIRFADDLSAVKDKLGYGLFLQLFSDYSDGPGPVPYTSRKAEQAMAVGANPFLRNPKNFSVLPAHSSTLHTLSPLSASELEAAKARGDIHPDMTGSDAKALYEALRTVAPERLAPPPWDPRDEEARFLRLLDGLVSRAPEGQRAGFAEQLYAAHGRRVAGLRRNGSVPVVVDMGGGKGGAGVSVDIAPPLVTAPGGHAVSTLPAETFRVHRRDAPMRPFYDDGRVTVYNGHVVDVLRALPAGLAHVCVTSPPYWGLRDYGIEPQVWGGNAACEHEWTTVERGLNNRHAVALARGDEGTQIGGTANHRDYRITDSFCRCGAWRGSLGLEPDQDMYVEHIVAVFREVKRVLRDDGTLWLNLGDSYATRWSSVHDEGGAGIRGGERWRKKGPLAVGLKNKDLVGIPWRVAFALQADGWWLRSDIIWAKPNPMPESVTDRPTKAHEYLFLLAKSERYYYDAQAVKEPGSGRATSGNVARDGTGRNRRSVWTIPTLAFPAAHFATFPERLVEPCIRAGASEFGCCRSCGAPYERILERSGEFGDWCDKKLKGEGINNQKLGGGRYPPGYEPPKTVGCRPTCGHGVGDTDPCVVLDPFGGAGTTALVAKERGRRAVVAELSGAIAR